MEGIHSAGGGSTGLDFSAFPRDYHYDTNQLPAQPADYEDFDFTSPFNFDLFPSTTQSASTFLANPFGTTESTFSPPNLPNIQSPPAQTQLFSASQSNNLNADGSNLQPAMIHPQTQLPPHQSTSAAPYSNQSTYKNTSHDAEPLFNDSESALLSGFLTGLDVDPNFIFNPILPPGMPSPPTGTYPPKREDELEREALGREVGDIYLGANAADESRWYDEEEEEDRKPEIDAEGEFEDEEGEYDADFSFRSANGTRGFKRISSADTRRGKTRVAMGSQGGTKGKKPKLSERRAEENSALAEEEDSGDVEMNPSTNSRNGRPNRIIKKTSRALSNSSSGATTTRKPSAKFSPPINPNEPSLPGEDFDNSLNQSRGPLTEVEKRSNHIASEQRRRNAIRLGFQDLVDLLSAGEEASGIVVAPSDAQDNENSTPANGKGKKKGKGNGRGRGRKGEVATGGSKSVVLEKAAMYILWLERGNKGLEAEVERVEALLRNAQV